MSDTLEERLAEATRTWISDHIEQSVRYLLNLLPFLSQSTTEQNDGMICIDAQVEPGWFGLTETTKVWIFLDADMKHYMRLSKPCTPHEEWRLHPALIWDCRLDEYVEELKLFRDYLALYEQVCNSSSPCTLEAITPEYLGAYLELQKRLQVFF